MALGEAGWSVTMLCPIDYPHAAESYQQSRCLPRCGQRPASRIPRVAVVAANMLRGYYTLMRVVTQMKVKHVLLASYSEYLAPLWAWMMRRLVSKGVEFGAVVHDPVRNFVLGPLWWHRWSVSQGYSFLKHAFLHEPIDLDTGSRIMPVTCHVIPHAPYPFPSSVHSKEQVRSKLGIPPQAKVFISFGHLRDGKNINLVLQAMADVPEAWLLVVGTEADYGHLKSTTYGQMAEDLGIADRCRWQIGFATPQEVADFFAAADFAMLTYDARFRSASGVLNVAVTYRKPALVSCGDSNLASAVTGYDLGLRVKPDSASEIARGMRQLLQDAPTPNWKSYEQAENWTANALLVIKAFQEGE